EATGGGKEQAAGVLGGEKEPWEITRDEAIWGNYIPSGMNTERALKAQVKLWQKRYDSFSDSEKATLLPDNGIVAGLMRAKEHLDKANAHRDAVAKALSENKPVPPEILKDYPELTKKPHDNIPDVSVQKKVTVDQKAPEIEPQPLTIKISGGMVQ